MKFKVSFASVLIIGSATILILGSCTGKSNTGGTTQQTSAAQNSVFKSQAKCDEIKNNYIKNGVSLKNTMDKETIEVLPSIYLSDNFTFSGPGIIPSKIRASNTMMLMCTRKTENNTDGVTLFGNTIVIDKNKVALATKTIEKYLFFEIMESPDKEKIKEFYNSKMKNLKPDSYPDNIDITSGIYYLRLLTTQADAKGNIFLIVEMKVTY